MQNVNLNENEAHFELVLQTCTLESSVVFFYPLLKFFVLDLKFQATYLVFDFIFSSLFEPEFHLQLWQPQLVIMQSHDLTIHGGCKCKVALY